MLHRLKYLREKPLIEDITYLKPPLMYINVKPTRKPELLSRDCILPNSYQLQLDNNLFADIVSQPLRTDKLTRINYTKPFLLKFTAAIVKSSDVPTKKKAINIPNTTDNELCKVVVRTEFDPSFKKFQAGYTLLSKKKLEALVGKKNVKKLQALTPMGIMASKYSDFNIKNFEFQLDIELIEQHMMEELVDILTGLDVELVTAEPLHINWGAQVLNPSVNLLDASHIDDKYKTVLTAKFDGGTTTLDYNANSKRFVQFVYKLINYYR